MARVYDDNFDLVADIALGVTDQPSFVNDVVVTKTAAYFTNSLQSQIYSVGFDLAALETPSLLLRPCITDNRAFDEDHRRTGVTMIPRKV